MTALHPDCPDCTTGLDHCHGTLLLPPAPADAPECTDPGCADPTPARHAFSLPMTEVDSPAATTHTAAA